MAPELELWSSCRYLTICDGSADGRLEVLLDDNRPLDLGESGSGDEEVNSSRERLTILRGRGTTTFRSVLESLETPRIYTACAFSLWNVELGHTLSHTVTME